MRCQSNVLRTLAAVASSYTANIAPAELLDLSSVLLDHYKGQALASQCFTDDAAQRQAEMKAANFEVCLTQKQTKIGDSRAPALGHKMG